MKRFKIATLILFAIFSSVASLNAQDKLSKGKHFAQVNGIRMHYEVRGQGPVCLLPTAGWGIPIEYIMPIPAFEKHFTVVYYDTRLSGGSGGPKDPLAYTADHFMQDMDSLRAYLGQPKIWLAGHSMGGFQALNYAIQHNDKLNGLIVMGSIIKFDGLRNQQYDKLLNQRKEYPYYKKHPDIYTKAMAVQSGKDKRKYSLKETFDITGGLYCHDPKIGQKVFSSLNFRDTVGRYIGTSGFYSKNVYDSLKNITVPTLVMCGDDDFICDHISQSDRIHQQIASSELVILQNCGHILWAEQPKAFSAAFEGWINKQKMSL